MRHMARRARIYPRSGPYGDIRHGAMSAFDRYVAAKMAQLAQQGVAPVGNPFQGMPPIRRAVPPGPPPSERQQAVLNQNINLGPTVPQGFVPPPQPRPLQVATPGELSIP